MEEILLINSINLTSMIINSINQHDQLQHLVVNNFITEF
jgi:hypothetical protein